MCTQMGAFHRKCLAGSPYVGASLRISSIFVKTPVFRRCDVKDGFVFLNSFFSLSVMLAQKNGTKLSPPCIIKVVTSRVHLQYLQLENKIAPHSIAFIYIKVALTPYSPS